MPGGTLVLATLGFHEHFALRRLSSLGAGRGDYIAAVTVKPPASAVMAAWESLRGLAARLGVTPLGLLEVDPRDFEGAVTEVIEWADSLAREVGAQYIVIEATGGARILTAAALLAAISLAKRYRVDYYIQSDTGEAWQVRIPGDLIGVITTPISQEKARILQTIIQRPGSTTHEIAEATGMHPKTVMNHVSKLKKQKLVIQKGRGRGLYPTSRAKLALYISTTQ